MLNTVRKPHHLIRMYDFDEANTRGLTNAVLTLGQRGRRWHNFKPTLVERLMFAGDRRETLNRHHLLFSSHKPTYMYMYVITILCA